jgi:hypothetical protein
MTAFLHRSRRFLVVLAVALGVTVALTVSTPAQAADAGPSASERARNNYGAISVGWWDHAWGASYDYSSKAKAKRAAQKACRKHSNYPGKCSTAVWVRNGCAAVSVRLRADGSVGRYGWAVNRLKKPAIRAAQHKCGAKCVKLTWVCTTRH